jgi:hypothetical protein
VVAMVASSWLASGAAAEMPAGYDGLVALFKDYQAWNAANTADVLADLGPAAIEKRRAGLTALQERLAAINPSGWSAAQKNDYLIVRSELDKQEFIFTVTRPWQRDPVCYVQALLEIPFAELPAQGEKLSQLQRRLRAVPGFVRQAQANLTAVPADYADLAIAYLEKSDGVEANYPYRAVPPPGVIGWYADLLERAARSQPALRNDIRKAHAAAQELHKWLEDNRGRMTARAGVGKKALDWYLENALLLPYDSDEIVTLSQRELDRLWAFYALERYRNQGLPEIERAKSADEYRSRVVATDKLVREWLAKKEFISIPDFIPVDLDEMGFNVPWIERQTEPNFWEQIQYRDPVPDHLHAVIPGHRFDDRTRKQNPHPIRANVRSGSRWQGWAVYLEEGPLQAGILDSRPRSRELIYIFGLWRAARSLGDVWNQRNEMTAGEVVKYWMDMTPLMDPNVARKYAHLRPEPGHGLEYTIGNIQMFNLLAEVRRQRGDKLVMRDFHDEFIARGQIPIALIRNEMTGYEGDVARFWKRKPLQEALASN